MPGAIEYKLPTWQKCSDKYDYVGRDKLTALELFIYDNEPGSAEEWRSLLAETLSEIIEEDRLHRDVTEIVNLRAAAHVIGAFSRCVMKSTQPCFGDSNEPSEDCYCAHAARKVVIAARTPPP